MLDIKRRKQKNAEKECKILLIRFLNLSTRIGDGLTTQEGARGGMQLKENR